MSRDPTPPWSVPLRLSEIAREPAVRRLEPDAAASEAVARALDLAGLPAFVGEVEVAPWHDGAEVRGRWTARVTYTCGLSLEPFDENLQGEFTVHAVPASSPLAGEPETPEGEVELDLEADDPPDVLAGETLDLAAYLIEHLALELEPFPRKPGAVFQPPPPEEPESPFAVLRKLRE